MTFPELILLAAGLSMDAFAASICKGLSPEKVRLKHIFLTGLYFGAFQAGMPLIGFLLGRTFQSAVAGIGHWIAFALLVLIGLNMIRESLGKEPETYERGRDERGHDAGALKADASFGFKAMLPLAVATSIDALAVGVTFAFLQVSIFSAAIVIGLVTFAFSAAGVKIGNVFGNRFKSKAEFAGGLILISIGLKILLEHAGFLAF